MWLTSCCDHVSDAASVAAMQKSIVTAVLTLVLAGGIAGCSGGSATPKATSPSTFDPHAAQREVWEQNREFYSAAIKLDICNAAKKGGVTDVKKYLTGEDMPFHVKYPDYDAQQWVEYCTSK